MYKAIVFPLLLIAFSSLSFAQSSPADSCDASQYHAFNKNYEAAINAALACLKTSKQPENIYANIGVYYEQLNDYSNALTNYTKAITIKPDNPQLRIMRAYYYANRKQFSTALSNINDAIALNKDVKYAYLAQGNINKRAGDITKAQASYKEALKQDPKFDAAETALGILEYEKKNYPKALEHFNSAQPNAYYFSSLYYYRGLIHKYNGDFNLAMKDFGTAILASSNNDSALLNRAEIYAYQRKNDSARMDWEKVKKVNPKNANLGNVILLIRRAEMKRNALNNTQISKNATVNNLYFRAKQLLFERRLKEAFPKIDDAIKTEPSNAALYVLSGEILLYVFEAEYGDEIEIEGASFEFEKNDYWSLGISDLNTAIKLNSNNAAAYYWRGAFYNAAKKYKEGKKDWDKSLQLNPTDIELKEQIEALKREMKN